MINKKEILLFSILNKRGENLNDEEKHFLNNIREDEKLFREFEQYIHLENFLLDTPKTEKFDTNIAWDAFSKKINNYADFISLEKQNTFKFKTIAAACISALLMAGVFFYTFNTNKKINFVESNSKLIIQTNNKKTTINNFNELASDTLKISQHSKLIVTAKNEIFISTDSSSIEEITISVPKGEKFKLILSDGTKVTLNADTQLTFPNIFENERSVNLKGEAFFEVAHDPLNPFNVVTDRLKTTVIGTKFNASAYPENTFNEIVLVEGKVSVMDHSLKKQILFPNQKAYMSSRQNLVISKADINMTTAWLHGALIFKNQSFRHIAKTLERTYDVEIKISTEKLKNSRFTAYFKKESLDDILEIFKTTIDFEYKIHNKLILIK